jgi:hypothetical protein
MNAERKELWLHIFCGEVFGMETEKRDKSGRCASPDAYKVIGIANLSRVPGFLFPTPSSVYLSMP